MIKIAILGKANSGKNTLAKMLTKEIRTVSKKYLSVKYIAFADPIKKIVHIMFPNLPKKFLYGSSSLRSQEIPGAFQGDYPLSVRQALMDVGTGLGRTYKKNIWLEAFEKTYNENINKDIIIISDLRFFNEYEFLKLKGFYIIKIYRDTINTINHQSETEQDGLSDDKFDFIISNNGSKSNLKLKVNEIINKLIV